MSELLTPGLLMPGSRVLVLGGRGFLGKHLVQALLREHTSVRVFDRPLLFGESIESDNVELVEGNFINGHGLEEALDGIDLVYHLISTTHPSTSNADPIADVESNLCGSLRLLQAMRVASVKRIVYVSSGGTVYGNPVSLPVTESHLLEPICSYGVVKVAVENYLRMHSRLYGMSANILRVSNPYGTHQHQLGAQGVIATFARKLVTGQPIEIWGDGSAMRDYIYIDDVIQALLRAGLQHESGTYNIGSGVGHSINDVVRILSAQLGIKGDVRHLADRKFDVHQIFLDIERARTHLGWRPSYSLEEGCAAYCRLVHPSSELVST